MQGRSEPVVVIVAPDRSSALTLLSDELDTRKNLKSG